VRWISLWPLLYIPPSRYQRLHCADYTRIFT
jgi:hypothetical protein